DVLGNLTQTQLPNNRAFEYLYYGSGHLQQTNWRDNDQLTVLAEYQRDRLHRETGRTSGLLDNETGYDTRGRITHQVARRMNESVFTMPVLDRRYRWDKRNHLIERSVSYGQGNDLFTSGHWYYNSYQYDPLGQLIQHLGSVQTEHFRYDEAANLFKDRQQSALHNQVHHSDQFDYQYDGFGRMVSRCEKGSTSGQHYHYDAENRIIAVDIHQGPLGYERAEYRYDILGRRIEKRLWKASAIANTLTYPTREPDEVQTFGWVGMVLTHEHSSTKPHTTVYHAYNDHSYTSLARIECTDTPANPRCAIYYTHSGLNGLPEALTNGDGHLVWQGQYGVWGNLQRQARPTGEFSSEQNLRFQGQYFDKETGLHYNTFRYYAPDLGRFTQQDPIGLAGGLNLYQYAPNPLTWVDPWGWAKDTVTVYHFTDKAGYEAIIRSGEIRMSSPPPKSGNKQGVYVTPTSPEALGHKIATSLNITSNKATHVFKLEVPKNSIKLPKNVKQGGNSGRGSQHKRVIYSNIKLNTVDWIAGEVIQVPNKKGALTERSVNWKTGSTKC
ncbi:RHS domain-containing protein, partial [Providencia stuartii]